MDKESKKLLTVLIALVIVSLFLTYYRSFVSRDYEIIQGGEGEEGMTETNVESFTVE